jgi:hypothetical protein
MKKKLAKKKTTTKKKVVKKKTTKKQKQDRTSVMQAVFLAAFSKTGNIQKSAKIAKISRADHYRWSKEDEAYQVKFDQAQSEAITYLEDIAIQRATEGWKEPVYYKGEDVGKVRKFSDALLMFMLKGAAPNKYRERIDQNHSGAISQTIEIRTDGVGKPNESKNNTPE